MEINMSDLAKCVRDIRNAEGISAEELGEKAGVSANNITRFETGRIKNPSFDTVHKLIKAIADLDIVKFNNFDFSHYDKQISDLIKSSMTHDNTEFNKNKSNFIDRNLDYISGTEIDYINFYIKSKRFIHNTKISANRLNTSIKLLNDYIESNNIDHLKSTQYIKQLLNSKIADDPIISAFFMDALNILNEDKLFNIFEYLLEYIASTFPSVVEELKANQSINMKKID